MDQNTEEIKKRLDIVDIVREYVPLKQAGSNFKGLCPFHHEKSPSFMVSSEKQIFHCFGCSEGGDIFTFIQKIEGLEFYDALKLLASKAGVKIKEHNPAFKKQQSSLEEIVEESAQCYHETLVKDPKAKDARAYLKKRNISEQTIQTFQIGYALDSYNHLSNYLQKKGFKNEAIVQSGMCLNSQKYHGIYDRFRDRIMIPLYNSHGVICGFTGRLLKERANEGKYVNTPQTPIYDKSQILFGLHLAKQSIRELDYVILVEGNMDVIASYQAGVKNVVATSGTALTEKQIQILKRYTTNLMFCFDEDVAGFHAAVRGMSLVLKHDVNVKVITLRKGKDPDECIQEGVAYWTDSIKQARPFMDYYFEKILSLYNMQDIMQKKQAASKILSMIAKISHPIEQDHYIKKMSDIFNVAHTILYDTLKKQSDGMKQEKPVQISQKPVQAIKQSQPYQENLIRLLSILFMHPKQIPYVAKHLPQEAFLAPYGDIYKKMTAWYTTYGSGDVDFAQGLMYVKIDWEMHQQEVSILPLYFEKEFAQFTEQHIVQELVHITNFLKKQYIKKQLKEIESQIKLVENGVSTQDLSALLEQFQELSSQLVHLSQ